jgi:hypothetical protein
MEGLKIGEGMTVAIDGVAALYLHNEFGEGLAQPRDLGALWIKIVIIHRLSASFCVNRTDRVAMPRPSNRGVADDQGRRRVQGR